jgi:hypothetical protein
MLADSTARVWAQWPQPPVCPETHPTATVDTSSPAKDRAEKGTIWPISDRRSRRAQTHRRLSSKDGTVPTAVASTLADTAGMPTSPTRMNRTIRLIVVATADTPA